MATAATVPAWRRLGLKLKHEQQHDSTSLTTDSPPSPSKKRKTTQTYNELPARTAAHSAQTSSTKPTAPLKPALKKSPKSVSKTVGFSADTAPAADSAPAAETSADDTLHDSLLDDDAQAVAQRHAKKREKRRQKQQTKSESAIHDRDQPLKPYLQYLHDYSERRDRWKFNKNHQNQLFKYIFDFHKVPIYYHPVLVEYVAGLQGQSARQRVMEAAERELDLLKDDQELKDMSNEEEERKKLNEQAFERDWKIVNRATRRQAREVFARKSSPKEDFSSKLARKERAASLLERLLRDNNVDVSNEPNEIPGSIPETFMGVRVMSTNPKKIRKRTRGRKKREQQTGIPDDDEISDLSSSSGDESDRKSEDQDIATPSTELYPGSRTEDGESRDVTEDTEETGETEEEAGGVQLSGDHDEDDGDDDDDEDDEDDDEDDEDDEDMEDAD